MRDEGPLKLIRRKHPRRVGMRIGFKDLTAWSFLMAMAHGAGLMLVPVLLELSEPVQSMKALALGLLGRRSNSYGSTPR